MADMITANFSVNEMACRCGCGTSEMDPEFMRMLQELRDQMQGPLRVSSGRRCDHHNDRVSTAKNKKNGVHTLGQASNILISGERPCSCLKKPVRLVSAGLDCPNVAHTRTGLSTWTRNRGRLYGVTNSLSFLVFR